MKTYYGTKRIEAWPAEQEGERGYGVQYADGYQSWSPQAAFEAAYQPTNAMGFGHALAAMKEGHCVKRGSDGAVVSFNGKKFQTLTSVYWSPSQDDLLADDWGIV